MLRALFAQPVPGEHKGKEALVPYEKAKETLKTLEYRAHILAYNPKDIAGFTRYSLANVVNDDGLVCNLYVAKDVNENDGLLEVMLLFRGTKNFASVLRDLEYPSPGDKSLAADAENILVNLNTILKSTSPKTKVRLSVYGHSLGATDALGFSRFVFSYMLSRKLKQNSLSEQLEMLDAIAEYNVEVCNSPRLSEAKANEINNAARLIRGKDGPKISVTYLSAMGDIIQRIGRHYPFLGMDSKIVDVTLAKVLHSGVAPLKEGWSNLWNVIKNTHRAHTLKSFQDDSDPSTIQKVSIYNNKTHTPEEMSSPNKQNILTPIIETALLGLSKLRSEPVVTPVMLLLGDSESKNTAGLKDVVEARSQDASVTPFENTISLENKDVKSDSKAIPLSPHDSSVSFDDDTVMVETVHELFTKQLSTQEVSEIMSTHLTHTTVSQHVQTTMVMNQSGIEEEKENIRREPDILLMDTTGNSSVVNPVLTAKPTEPVPTDLTTTSEAKVNSLAEPSETVEPRESLSKTITIMPEPKTIISIVPGESKGEISPLFDEKKSSTMVADSELTKLAQFKNGSDGNKSSDMPSDAAETKHAVMSLSDKKEASTEAIDSTNLAEPAFGNNNTKSLAMSSDVNVTLSLRTNLTEHLNPYLPERNVNVNPNQLNDNSLATLVAVPTLTTTGGASAGALLGAVMGSLFSIPTLGVSILACAFLGAIIGAISGLLLGLKATASATPRPRHQASEIKPSDNKAMDGKRNQPTQHLATSANSIPNAHTLIAKTPERKLSQEKAAPSLFRREASIPKEVFVPSESKAYIHYLYRAGR